MSRLPEKWVSCPQCGSASLYSSQNKFRPFCSARCKGVDLGAWASEQFALAEQTPGNSPDFERH
ncbi:MAG: DNA gyrase inhibitor YacG [Burkholderiaceae bacterium]